MHLPGTGDLGQVPRANTMPPMANLFSKIVDLSPKYDFNLPTSLHLQRPLRCVHTSALSFDLVPLLGMLLFHT